MREILLIRETIVSVCKRYEAIFLFVLKFFVGAITFNMINSIGYQIELFNMFAGPPYAFIFTLLLGLMFAALPITLSYGLMIAAIGIQISSAWLVAMVVIPLLLCVLFFYARLAPRESILILITFFSFYLRVPYAVPILAGLYFGITSVIPIAIGVFLWEFRPLVGELLTETAMQEYASLTEIPEEFSLLYTSVLESVNANSQWVFTAFIFAMGVVVVYIISRMPINYSKDIAIGAGAIIIMVSFGISIIMTDMNVSMLSVFVFTILSALLAELVKFFDSVLDYRRAERVQFEDEHNYYYVKVIPKIALNNGERPEMVQQEPDPEEYYRHGRPRRRYEPPDQPELPERPERPRRRYDRLGKVK